MLQQSDRLIARHTGWLAATSVVELIAGLAFVFFATRILGPSGFGALAVIMATAALAHGVVSIGGSDTVMTFATRCIADGRPKDAAGVVRFVFLLSFGMSLCAYVVVSLIAALAVDLVTVDGTDTTALLWYAVVGVAIANNSSAIAVLRLADRLRLRFAVACAGNVVRIGLLAVFWNVGGDVLTVVWASLAGASVSGFGLLLAAACSSTRAGMGRLLASATIHLPKDVRRFHAATFGRTVVGAMGQNVDTILLAQWLDAADVGLYRVARQIVDITSQPFIMLRSAVQPVISRQWHGGQGRLVRATVSRFTVLSLLVAAVGLSVLATLRDWIAVLFLGPEFSGVGGLILILIPGAFMASLGVLGMLPIVAGRASPSLLSLSSGLAVSIPAILLLVPTHGVEGGAVARTTLSVVSFLVLFPFIMSTLRRSRTLQGTEAAG